MKKEKKFYNMKIYADPKTFKFEPKCHDIYDIYQYIKNPKLTKGDFIIVEKLIDNEKVILLLKFFNYTHSRPYETCIKNYIHVRNFDVFYCRIKYYLYCRCRVVCSTKDTYKTSDVILENLAGLPGYPNITREEYHILPKRTTRNEAKIIFGLYRQGMMKL